MVDIILPITSTMASQAIMQMRQCSDISACVRHSAAHASPMVMHAVIIEVSTPRS